jgi:histidinol-phosphate aminotransferase
VTDFDRRDWLKTVGLLAGGSAQLFAAPMRPAKSAGADGRTVRLSLNENPYGPAPSVIDALQHEFADLCRYTDTGYTTLLKAIAAKEGIPQDRVILGEILEPLGTHLSLQGGPGGEFIYSDPGYTALIDSAAAVGGIGVPVPLGRDMQNDLTAIASKVNGRTRAVFLVNPHNPTGTVTDPDELKKFVRAISTHALVIVDEAYLEFADAFPQRTLASLVGAGENVIVFRTFAKAYGLAGLDIGYGLFPPVIGQALQKQGLDNPHLFNRLAVAAATASLKEGNFIRRIVSQVAQERDIWLGLLRGLNVPVTASCGNFVFFKTAMPHADFAAAMLEEGIDIGRAFPPYERWARISIGLPLENALARAAVQRLMSKQS